jgi:ribosomal protein S18 acetylase RimI-like enzyme
LYSAASDGVADYIWTQLAEPGEDILDVGARRCARKDSQFSYTNCTMAESNGEVAGMMVAYRMEDNPQPAPDMDPVLRPYAILEQPGSYYICGIAIYPHYRNHGMGSRFIDIAQRDALARNLAQLSLIVFAQNTGAKRLYDRNGFYELARQPVVPHPLIHRTGDALLMVKDL